MIEGTRFGLETRNIDAILMSMPPLASVINMIFNIFKTIHIFSVIAWMAGYYIFQEFLCIILMKQYNKRYIRDI